MGCKDFTSIFLMEFYPPGLAIDSPKAVRKSVFNEFWNTIWDENLRLD